MSWLTLSMTLAFTALAMAASYWQRLALERDILIGTVRAAAQLLAVGYILQFVFSAQSPAFTVLMVAVMIAVATQNASRRGKGLPGVQWRVLAALTLAEVVTIGLMLLIRVIQPTPQYVLSISGMIVGNAMVVAGLLLNRLQGEVDARRDELRVLLSLGATPRQAIQNQLRAAVRACMIPSVDSLKTVGLVQLPGMMTGQILAGASPILAVRYQILIMFSLTSAAALCSIALGLLTYRLYFNQAYQLVR
ncbi:MAG: ABC transporter permease [Bacillota bacterium]